MANDPQGPQKSTMNPDLQSAPQDEQARQLRAVEGIRHILQMSKAKDAAAGQIRAWMKEEKG